MEILNHLTEEGSGTTWAPIPNPFPLYPTQGLGRVTSIHISAGILAPWVQSRGRTAGDDLVPAPSCWAACEGWVPWHDHTSCERGLSCVAALPGLLELLSPSFPTDLEEDKVSTDQSSPLLRAPQHALLIPLWLWLNSLQSFFWIL